MNPDSEPYHLSLPLPRYCPRDEQLRLGSSFSHFQGSVLPPPTLPICPLQIFLPLALSTCVAPTLPVTHSTPCRWPCPSASAFLPERHASKFPKQKRPLDTASRFPSSWGDTGLGVCVCGPTCKMGTVPLP